MTNAHLKLACFDIHVRGDDHAAAMTRAIARHHRCHVSIHVMVNLPWRADATWGQLPDQALAEAYALLRKDGRDRAAHVRDLEERGDVRTAVEVVEVTDGNPPRAAARLAQCADVAFIAGPPVDGIEALRSRQYIEALMLESGRPVMVVPRSANLDASLSHVAVAWRATPQAARALHDALPLLSAGATIDLVTVCAQEDDENVAPLVEALKRRNFNPRVTQILRREDSVGLALIHHVRTTGAQFLVCGAYGHTRSREWVLGGVTRELLVLGSIPVLFSH